MAKNMAQLIPNKAKSALLALVVVVVVLLLEYSGNKVASVVLCRKKSLLSRSKSARRHLLDRDNAVANSWSNDWAVDSSVDNKTNRMAAPFQA